MTTFAKESTHWYLPSGSPFYTTIGANGKERNVTLRDARKVGAFPSVTGIIRCAAAPGLERWKLRQLALSCLTLPRTDGESEDAFLVRAEKDAQQQGRAAAERGTAIHAAIEKHYRGEQPDEDLWDWVKATRNEINTKCGDHGWSAERSFACDLGYGGKTDLHSTGWVIDVKGKEGDVNIGKLAMYDEHLMQLAAYRYGLAVPDARCGIVFVGRDVPSAVLMEASADDLEKGWEMFKALLAYWRAKNCYKPGVV